MKDWFAPIVRHVVAVPHRFRLCGIQSSISGAPWFWWFCLGPARDVVCPGEAKEGGHGSNTRGVRETLRAWI